MISTRCPICLKSKPYESLLGHLEGHGYDSIQADILLNYDRSLKGLIDNINLELPQVDEFDERFILYREFLLSMYRFVVPTTSQFGVLKVEKGISEVTNIYREILGCKIYKIKTKLKERQPMADIDRYELVVLAEIYEGLLAYQRELSKKEYIVSWDDIEFQDGKVAVEPNEFLQKSIITVPSSLKILNYIKDGYFKARFKDAKFKLTYTQDRRRDLTESNVREIEAILKANAKSITESLKAAKLKGKAKGDTSHFQPFCIEKAVDRAEYVRNKHEYIQTAVRFCEGDDKVYPIKENYNGTEEGALIIKYTRASHIYLLVENENINRSAHLYAFDISEHECIERVYGFYSSEMINKRGLIKEGGIDFKKEFNAAFNVKVLYHSDKKKYKDHLLEYLNIIG